MSEPIPEFAAAPPEPPASTPPWRVVIVGTGVSALLLAQALLVGAPVAELLLVGPASPLRPHVLSFWSDGPTPFDPFAAWSWSAVRVASPEAPPREIPLTRYAYRTLRARPWAEAARQGLLGDPRVRFVEARVTEIEAGAEGARVVSEAGSIAADWVFDSRVGAEDAQATQRFLGWELALELPHGHTTPILMDFRTPSEGDLRFGYLLPLAPDRLFVEHVSYAPCNHEAALEAWLREALGIHDWRILDQESGITPIFGAPPPRAQGRVVRVGVGAGLAKVTTGYALTRLWRDADRIAASLAQGTPDLREREPALGRLADAFFLDLLRDEPERIGELLSTLFARAPGDAVLAFLDDAARPWEQLEVAAAMPHWLDWALRNRPEKAG